MVSVDSVVDVVSGASRMLPNSISELGSVGSGSSEKSGASLDVPQVTSSSPDMPHTMLSPVAELPHTMLSPVSEEPQTMLSPLLQLPQTMLSPSELPHTTLLQSAP